MMGDRDRITLLEKQIQQMQARQAQMQQRLYATWGVACTGIFGAFVLGLSPEARAQFGVTLASLNSRLTAVEGRTAALEEKTRFVSVSGTDMIIEGANLHIRNGLGATNGNPGVPLTADPALTSVNSLGNLIIGYNTAFGAFGDERGGSHNLVIGNLHDYSSFGGLVAGQANRIIAPGASVTGGDDNTASGIFASVSGGRENTASAINGSVSGGLSNIAGGQFATVAGGRSNDASGYVAAVSGGNDNTASGDYASVSGGQSNIAGGQFASVSGGGRNQAIAVGSSLSGGFERGIIPIFLGPDFSYTWRAGNSTAGP